MTRDNRQHALQAEWRMCQETWTEAEVLRAARHPRGALAGSLASLQQQREDADYDREVEVDEQQVTEVRQEAEQVVEHIRTWLKGEGWLE